jgi:hypothetical protein
MQVRSERLKVRYWGVLTNALFVFITLPPTGLWVAGPAQGRDGTPAAPTQMQVRSEKLEVEKLGSVQAIRKGIQQELQPD